MGPLLAVTPGPKQTDRAIFDWRLDPFDVGPPPLGKDFHLRRLDATYVDFRHGRVQQPSEQISASAVDAAYDLVERQLEFCERLTSNASVEGLASAMERAIPDSGETRKVASTYERAGLDLMCRLGITLEDLDVMMDMAAEVLGPPQRDAISEAWPTPSRWVKSAPGAAG